MSGEEQFLTKLYRERCNGMDVLLRLTSYEVEHLNNLTDISYRARKSSFLREARKEKRRLHQWEKHLLAMDRKLWKKVRDAEKLAFKEE